jgi:hypothetical protein
MLTSGDLDPSAIAVLPPPSEWAGGPSLRPPGSCRGGAGGRGDGGGCNEGGERRGPSGAGARPRSRVRARSSGPRPSSCRPPRASRTRAMAAASATPAVGSTSGSRLGGIEMGMPLVLATRAARDATIGVSSCAIAGGGSSWLIVPGRIRAAACRRLSTNVFKLQGSKGLVRGAHPASTNGLLAGRSDASKSLFREQLVQVHVSASRCSGSSACTPVQVVV